MKKVYLVGISAAAAVLLIGAIAILVARNTGDLGTIRAATRTYRDIEVAKADGYEQFFECIDKPSEGAMGVHYIMPSRFDDQLNLKEPEVLVYDVRPSGKAKLVAVEYVIPAAAWSGSEAPTFLGQELAYKTTMGPHELDPYYEVHVWAWQRNPSGRFADWNPRVTCTAS
jgi:hypothetical protein